VDRDHDSAVAFAVKNVELTVGPDTRRIEIGRRSGSADVRSKFDIADMILGRA
jgi:hypothetical protein